MLSLLHNLLLLVCWIELSVFARKNDWQPPITAWYPSQSVNQSIRLHRNHGKSSLSTWMPQVLIGGQPILFICQFRSLHLSAEFSPTRWRAWITAVFRDLIPLQDLVPLHGDFLQWKTKPGQHALLLFCTLWVDRPPPPLPPRGFFCQSLSDVQRTGAADTPNKNRYWRLGKPLMGMGATHKTQPYCSSHSHKIMMSRRFSKGNKRAISGCKIYCFTPKPPKFPWTKSYTSSHLLSLIDFARSVCTSGTLKPDRWEFCLLVKGFFSILDNWLSVLSLFYSPPLPSITSTHPDSHRDNPLTPVNSSPLISPPFLRLLPNAKVKWLPSVTTRKECGVGLDVTEASWLSSWVTAVTLPWLRAPRERKEQVPGKNSSVSQLGRQLGCLLSAAPVQHFSLVFPQIILFAQAIVGCRGSGVFNCRPRWINCRTWRWKRLICW